MGGAFSSNPPIKEVCEADILKFKDAKPFQDKLLTQVESGCTPVVILSCGSFSPPTLLHLRIFEDARDALEEGGKVKVIGGYMSPTHAAYGKSSLVEMHHRLNMVHAAAADSDWLMPDPWECGQEGWTRTAVVMKRLSEALGQVKVQVGQEAPREGCIKVMLLCGGDLLESFVSKKADGSWLWAVEDQQIILAQHGVVCIQRAGTDLEKVISQHEILRNNKHNICSLEPAVQNTISSTVVRKQLQEGKSIKYLVSDGVRDYIYKNSLWAPMATD